MNPHSLGQAARYADLLRATEALRNWQAVGVLIATALGAGLLLFLGTMLAARLDTLLLSGLAGFLALLFFPVGLSAAGLLLMDQARGLPVRSLRAALLGGGPAALRILAVALAGLALVLLFYVLMALVLFLCKLPFLGPLLYGLSLPLLVLMAGMLFFSLYVALSMAGPVVWSGADIRGAVAMLWQIATQRLVELLISMLLLSLLLALVGGVLGSILGVGYSFVLGMSVPILGNQVASAFGGMWGMGMPGAGLGGGMAYMMAAGFGSLVIFALVGGALLAMAVMGLNLIYLRVAADLDPGAADQLIGGSLAALGRKAQELQEAARRRAGAGSAPATAEAAPGVAPEATPEATPEVGPAAVTPAIAESASPSLPAADAASGPLPCSRCQAPVGRDDRYCGECGHKLRED